MYEKGQYLCEIVSQHLGESKNRQTPYFAIEVWPTHRIHPNEEEPEQIYADSTRTVFMYLTPKTAEFVTRDLRAIGFTGNAFSDLDPENPHHQSLVGRSVKCKCEHETYEGKERDKFALFTGNGFEHVKLEPKRKRELDAMFGKHLKANRPPVTTSVQSEMGLPEPNDPIPF